ncbi:MAG: hypothetical protein K6F31_00485 [Acetatifactor sp.]|nr:hypothetical protein [Acetatifactor sp.]
MSEKKTDGAMRLWEAMEGVDPELLLRSEKKTEKKKVVPFARFTRAAAACFALFVIGAACFATLHNGGKKEANAEMSMEARSESGGKNSKAGSSQLATDKLESTIALNEAYESYADEPEALEEANPMPASATANAIEAKADGEPKEDVDSMKSHEEAVGEYTLKLKPDLSAYLRSGESDQANSGEGTQSDTVYYVAGYANAQAYLSDKQLEVAFNLEDPVAIKDQQVAAVIYAYVSSLDLELTDDKKFNNFVTIRIYDQNRCMTDCYAISGKYATLNGLADTYEILDEDYDYDTLVTFLKEAAREE